MLRSIFFCSFFLVSFIFSSNVYGQDPLRFNAEIEVIKNKEFAIDQEKEVVVFTGSSSIRMWTDVQNYYPQINAINTGFGGSHFTDLIHYKDQLISRFNPDRIFIYEGDNDTDSDKTPEEILAAAAYLYGQLRAEFPEAKLYFISPKPSIARWHLQEKYMMVNSLLKQFCEFDKNLTFVDVWSPMIGDDGKPLPDVFIEDNLHMNEKGYSIWGKVIGEYLK